jgi:hypothetical protein
MPPFLRLSSLVGVLGLAACASVPSGPSVMVLPGTGKSFDQFRLDDATCRQYANQQVGGATPGSAATDSGVRTAVVGTAIGAAAGAVIAGRGGAAVGAGTGLLVGSVAGAGAGEGSYYAVQRRYDFSYQQCMYANGHRVPVSGRFVTSAPNPHYPPSAPPPPPPGAAPPPPPGAAPPPPPNAPPPPRSG